MTRRLSFPKLELARLPAPEQVVMPEGTNYKNSNNKHYSQKLEKLYTDLPQQIFKCYDEAHRIQATENYNNWNKLQLDLAILLIKPDAIERIDAEYQHLLASGLADNLLVTLNHSDLTHDYSKRNHFIEMMVINKLPRAIRLAIWRILKPDFILDNFSNRVDVLRQGLVDLLLDYPKEGFTIAIDLLPLFYEHRTNRLYSLDICQYLDSRICVPYIIANMNAKTHRKFAHEFIDNFPETFYNELVYILFTKPCDDWYKDAHKNAKKLVQYMIDNESSADNHLTQLRAATHRYDAQTKDTPLTDFINNYIDNHQQITQQKKALKEAESTITLVTPKQMDTNDNGLPQSLLNTDWQKQTRKRKFELDETIWNREVEQTASKQIPILEALTPPIIARTKQPLPIDAFEQLLLMLKLSTEDKPIPALAEVLPAFTSESLTHLADELWHDYIENRVAGGYSAYFPEENNPRIYGIFNTKNKWFMNASSWLADETLADKVWRFMKNYESDSHVRSSILHSFKVLAALASTYPDSKRGDAALKMLIKLSNKARSTLRAHAQSALEGYAKRLDLSMEALAERLLPDFDLNTRGTKVVDYHPSATDSRKLTISLTPELTFTYQDETGKTYKTAPKARVTDDVAAVNEFLHQHKEEKKELRAISTDLPKTLEKMMISQRTVSLADFMRYYVHHPVMTVFAQQLLWQIQLTDQAEANNQHPFRVSASLELLDSEDSALNDKNLNNALVSLVHPMHLSATDIQQWAEIFSDYEIIQPFEQLSRPLYYLTDAEKTTNKIQRFDEVRFARGSLMGLTSATKGWEGFSHGRGDYHGFSKNMNGHHLAIHLYDGFPMWDKVPDDDKGHKIERIELPKDIDNLSVSELLGDINEMARVS